jgi:hypothetical protein
MAHDSEQRAFKPREHFAYEEFADATAPSGTSYVIHPLGLKEARQESSDTLIALYRHLKATHDRYGITGSLTTGDGKENIARLRFKTLCTISWVWRYPTDMVGRIMALKRRDWKVDKDGNVVDEEGVKWWDWEGKRVKRRDPKYSRVAWSIDNYGLFPDKPA